MSTSPTPTPVTPGMSASAMCPAMTTTALPNRVRSAPINRSATQAPMIVKRYTAPPYAPMMPFAMPSSMPSPPRVTV